MKRIIISGMLICLAGCSDDGLAIKLSDSPETHRDRMDMLGSIENVRVQMTSSFNARIDKLLEDIETRISKLMDSIDSLAKSINGLDVRLSVLEAKVNDAEGLLSRGETMRESRLKQEEWKQ